MGIFLTLHKQSDIIDYGSFSRILSRKEDTPMRRFTKKFYARMLIFAGGFAALLTLLLQTMFDRIEIEHDKSVLAWFFILPLIYAVSLSLFTYAMAKHHTNVLRRYEFETDNEKVFYILYAVIIALISAGETGFLMYKLLPFLDKALAYALKDAQIKNETPEMRQQIIDTVNARYASYRTASFIAAGAVFAVKTIFAGLSVPKLIAAYRDPPDYWSGRKKKKD